MYFRRYPSLAVAVIALAIRIAYCVVAVFVFEKAPPGGPGHDGYVEIAESLVSGAGYRIDGELIFFRPPTYVLFLVPWVALPITQFWILGAQALVGAATCGVVTRISLRFVPPILALLSGMALAVCPWHVHFTANGMTPVLAAFLTSVLLWLWISDRSTDSGTRSFACGAIYATLALCHPDAVLLGPFWVVDRLWRTVRSGRRYAGLKGIGLFAIAAGAVMSPWVIRNYVASGRWILFSNSAGYQYFLDRDMPLAPGRLSRPGESSALDQERQAELLRAERATRSETQSRFKGIGAEAGKSFDEWMINDLCTNPWRIPRRLMRNGWWFWFGDRPSMLVLHLVYKGPLLVLALAGVWKGIRHRLPVAPVVWCVLAFWSVHALVVGYIPHAAYCIVVLGPCCILAITGLSPRSVRTIQDAASVPQHS